VASLYTHSNGRVADQQNEDSRKNPYGPLSIKRSELKVKVEQREIDNQEGQAELEPIS
jgi:hypothetical protein